MLDQYEVLILVKANHEKNGIIFKNAVLIISFVLRCCMLEHNMFLSRISDCRLQIDSSIDTNITTSGVNRHNRVEDIIMAQYSSAVLLFILFI
jgi:hypothetical protein